jgi:hypothetical protein
VVASELDFGSYNERPYNGMQELVFLESKQRRDIPTKSFSPSCCSHSLFKESYICHQRLCNSAVYSDMSLHLNKVVPFSAL